MSENSSRTAIITNDECFVDRQIIAILLDAMHKHITDTTVSISL